MKKVKFISLGDVIKTLQSTNWFVRGAEDFHLVHLFPDNAKIPRVPELLLLFISRFDPTDSNQPVCIKRRLPQTGFDLT